MIMVSNTMLLSTPSIKIKRIPTQRTSARIARLEPLEQTTRMEQMLACRTLLRRQLLVGADDGVADGAFGLAFESASDVLAPGCDAILDTSVLV